MLSLEHFRRNSVSAASVERSRSPQLPAYWNMLGPPHKHIFIFHLNKTAFFITCILRYTIRYACSQGKDPELLGRYC